MSKRTYSDQSVEDKKEYKTTMGYIILERRVGTETWNFHFKLYKFWLWKMLYRLTQHDTPKSLAIAYVRLLKRKNFGMEYAVFYEETKNIRTRHWLTVNGR